VLLARLPGTNLSRCRFGQPDAQARVFTARVSDDCLDQIFDCFPDEMKRQPRSGRTRCKVTCFEFWHRPPAIIPRPSEFSMYQDTGPPDQCAFLHMSGLT